MEPQNRISVPHEQSEYTRQIDALQRQLEAAEHLIHRKNCDLAHVESALDDAYAAGRLSGLREAAKIANARQGWHGELIANQIEQVAQGEPRNTPAACGS